MSQARLAGAVAPRKLVVRVCAQPSRTGEKASDPVLSRNPHGQEKVLAVVKIQIPAGQATPAPPVGTALGPHGVAIMDFCKAYNAATEAQRGTIVPVEITVFEDRTFTFVLKTPPTPVLLREAAGIDKAATEPGKEVAGTVTDAQVEEIAKVRCPTSRLRPRRRQGPGRRHRTVDGPQGQVASSTHRLDRDDLARPPHT